MATSRTLKRRQQRKAIAAKHDQLRRAQRHAEWLATGPPDEVAAWHRGGLSAVMDLQIRKTFNSDRLEQVFATSVLFERMRR